VLLVLLTTLLILVAGVPSAATSGDGPSPRAEREPVPVSVRTVPLRDREGGDVRAVTSADQFSMVGLSWKGPAPDLMALRVRQGQGWSDWVTVGVADGTARAATASEPVWTGPTHEVEVRALRGVRPAPDVSVVLLDPGSTPADLDPPTRREGAVVVITRAGWGADESIRCRQPEFDAAVAAVTLHHTAGTNNYRPEDSPAIVRGIYTYHAQTLRWCDIGYHALVDRYGQVFEGRAGGLDRPVIGAHAGGFNRRTSGVAMMGLFTGEVPTGPQATALAGFLDWKLALHGLDPLGETTLVSEGGGTSRYPPGASVRIPVLFGHRDVGYTECPGDDGYALLPFLRSVAAAT